MAATLPAWFVHALNEEVDQLAQQMQRATRGAVRQKNGVVGKTYPFNLIAQTFMTDAVRDQLTTYSNSTLTKRRAQLFDRNAALLIDDFDKVKTPADIDSAFKTSLAAARNRDMDAIAISGLAGVGGALGTANTVNEAAETNAQAALPAGQIIANAAAGLTVAKIVQTAEIMNSASVPQEDRYFFYSPHAMTNMLLNTQVTSSDYSTIQALMRGGFPMDQTWMGFHWRMISGFIDPANPTTTQILPKAANIRQCVAWQKQGIGVAIGLEPEIQVNEAPHAWNNTQLVMKLSMGAVRIQDSYVVRVDIDESV